MTPARGLRRVPERPRLRDGVVLVLLALLARPATAEASGGAVVSGEAEATRAGI